MSPRGGTTYAGTGALVRLALRRDRVLIPLWAVGLAALCVSSAQATLALYPDPASLGEGIRTVLDNPSITALYGPVTDPTSPDSFAVLKTLMLGIIGVGLLCFSVVRRHTRTEEEEGRLELLGAGAVGRRAPLTAALIVAGIATLATVLVTVVGMVGIGMDLVGTLAFGTAWLVAGLVMTGATAVAAQLTTTTRGAGALALSFFGVAFLLRAVGDATDTGGSHPLTWVSPLGWAEKASPYGQDRFWVLALGLAFCGGCVAVAYALLGRRDLGAGLLPGRPGPARAGRALASPLGLAWRLARGSVLGWTVAYAVLGAVVGSLAGSALDMLKDPAVADMLRKLGNAEGTLLDTFFATELKIMGVVATAAGVSAVLRLHGEERSGRAEQVLATATPRRSWLGAYAALGLGIPAWLMAVGGLLAAAASRSTPQVPSVLELLGAALSTLPAVWLLVATALALVGVLPRWSALAWGVLAVAFALGEFGSLLRLPSWLVDVSPYPHLPPLPGGAMAWTSTVVMVLAAAVIALVTFVGFRRRDIATQ